MNKLTIETGIKMLKDAGATMTPQQFCAVLESMEAAFGAPTPVKATPAVNTPTPVKATTPAAITPTNKASSDTGEVAPFVLSTLLSGQSVTTYGDISYMEGKPDHLWVFKGGTQIKSIQESAPKGTVFSMMFGVKGWSGPKWTKPEVMQSYSPSISGKYVILKSTRDDYVNVLHFKEAYKQIEKPLSTVRKNLMAKYESPLGNDETWDDDISGM